MTIDIHSVTRRTVLGTTALGALGVLVGPVAATPSRTTRARTTDAINRIERMLRTIDEIQGRVANGETDVHETIHAHTFLRQDNTQLALQEISGITGDSKTVRTPIKNHLLKRIAKAQESLGIVRSIVEDDIELLESVDDRGTVGDILALERALLQQTDSAIDAVDRLGVMPGDNITGQ